MVVAPYPLTLRLYAIAAERWSEIDSAYATLDIIGQRPFRFCGLVYGWCVRNMDPDRREQFDADLAAPLPGQETKAHVSEMVAEIEGQAFMAAMAQHKMLTGKG